MNETEQTPEMELAAKAKQAELEGVEEENEQMELLKDIRYTLEGFENLLQDLLKHLSKKKRKPAKKAVKKGKRK